MDQTFSPSGRCFSSFVPRGLIKSDNERQPGKQEGINGILQTQNVIKRTTLYIQIRIPASHPQKKRKLSSGQLARDKQASPTCSVWILETFKTLVLATLYPYPFSFLSYLSLQSFQVILPGWVDHVDHHTSKTSVVKIHCWNVGLEELRGLKN